VSSTTLGVPGAVLSSFEIAPICDFGGQRDRHWLAVENDRRAVLRRYSRQPFGDIGYEIRVLAELRSRGWPVPDLIRPPTEIAGDTWSVIEWLPGEPQVERTADAQRARGRLLAELHEDLASLSGLGQRGRCRESHEVVADPGLDVQLAQYEKFFPEEARIMRWHLDRARALFELYGTDSVRRVALHSDFAPWNLLYQDCQLSGILDFESTHRNLFVADFALAWRGRDDAVIAGYHELRPLTDLDWALLTPVFWSWMFLGVADSIQAMVAGRTRPADLEWTIRNLLKRSPLMGREALPYEKSNRRGPRGHRSGPASRTDGDGGNAPSGREQRPAQAGADEDRREGSRPTLART
jgi:Ser/Thr protein kinase RdoA (MazF antagonist)